MISKKVIFLAIALLNGPLQAVDNVLQHVFSTIFHNSMWGGKESVSGSGSDLKGTIAIRKDLPKLIENYNISSIVDAPCGDFWWMKELKLQNCLDWYLGIDIVEGLIEQNLQKYGNEKINFITQDISSDLVPTADLIICRDVFLHIQFIHIKRILNNFKKSNSTYLLASTYAKTEVNQDRPEVNNRWRPINLEKAPFNFPKPLTIIKEDNKLGKHVALWKIEDLPYLDI